MFNRIILAILLTSMSLAHADLTTLSDQQMAAETGQALFSLGYIAPGANNNPSTDTGFYKLGMQAQLDINTNIRRLRLGCDTPTSGGTACDIDVSHIALTGIVPLPDKYGKGASGAGVPSDFTLNNPFIELAIKSPTNAAQRRLIGFRLGAESAWGMFSAGLPPRNSAGEIPADNLSVIEKPGNHTGVTSISGHLNVEIRNAKIPTYICSLLLGGANSDYSGCKLGGGLYAGDSTVNSDKPKAGDNRYDLNLKRVNRIELPLVAEAVGGLLGIGGKLNEDLRFLHLIYVGSDPNGNRRYDRGEGESNFSLSAQSENLQWRVGTTSEWRTAQKGWWIDLPTVTLRDFKSRAVYATVDKAVTGLALKDVSMNQVPVNNCYGSLFYC